MVLPTLGEKGGTVSESVYVTVSFGGISQLAKLFPDESTILSQT